MCSYLQQLYEDFEKFEIYLPSQFKSEARALLTNILARHDECADEAQSAVALLCADVNAIVDMRDYMHRIGDLYIMWRARIGHVEAGNDAAIMEGYTPPMVCLMANMLENLGGAWEGKYARAAMASAFMADLPNDNPFHGNAHYRDVTATTFRILVAYQQLRAAKDLDCSLFPELDMKDMALLLCASAIHDFCHDGKGNNLEGRHVPMRLEQGAFDNAMQGLIAMGLDENDLHKIRIMILTTDVSYSAQALSPSRILTKCYGYWFEGKDKPVTNAEDYSFLADALCADNKLTLMAMMLEEADLFCSVGLSYEYAKMTTVLVAEETKILSTKASTLHGFIEMICNGVMASPASRKLFKSTFEHVYKNASEDVRKDRDYAVL